MGRFGCLAGILACLVLLTLTAGGAVAAENRSALVIGNGAYAFSPLKNPANDARAISKALEQCGFSVILVIDSDRPTMRQALRRFFDQIKNGGVGLFYYAGHGLQVRGENYLVPIDADLTHEYEVADQCLSANQILGAMEQAGNRLNIVVLDACRNNPFQRSFRSADSGLARMDAPVGSLLAYATAPGSVALDGEKDNGLYTSQLLKYILTPGLEIGMLFRQVRADVMALTKRSQVPWESSSITGQFYFVDPASKNAGPPPGPPAAPDPVPTPQNLRSPEARWFIILGSFTPDHQSEADRLADRFRRRGLEVSLLNTNDYPAFRPNLIAVAAGPFESRDLAQSRRVQYQAVIPDAYIKAGW